MNDVVAAEVFEELRAIDHGLADHVVAHDLATEVSASLNDALDRFRVGAGHHDDVGGARLGHHLGFEVATVHRLQVSDDGRVWKRFPQGADAVQPFGENEWRASLQPIDPGTHGQRGGFEGFIDVGEVEGDLDNGFHGGLEVALYRRSPHHGHDKDHAKYDCTETT